MPTWGRGMRCAPSAATGRSAVRFGILPQVLPNFLSYVLLRFEINVRGATVIGFVGAGGIGQELYSVISFNYYQEIGAIIVLIILTVSADRPDVGEAAHARHRTCGAMPPLRHPRRPVALDARFRGHAMSDGAMIATVDIAARSRAFPARLRPPRR